ncbi:MAG: ABC transporter permease [Methanosarcinales archaeon]
MIRSVKAVLAVWEREMYNYVKNIYLNSLRLVFEPLLFVLVFGIGVGSRVDMGEISYLEFMAPGVVFMVAMNNSYMTTSFRLLIARDWDKYLTTTLTAPVTPSEIVMGYIFAGVTQAILASVIFIIILTSAFGINFGYIPLVMLFIIATSAFFSSLGVILCMGVKDPHHLMILTSLIIIPMSFFCGIFFPIEDLPKWIIPIISAIPLTSAVQSARAISLSLYGPTIWLELGYVIISAIIAFFIGIFTFKKKVVL